MEAYFKNKGGDCPHEIPTEVPALIGDGLTLSQNWEPLAGSNKVPFLVVLANILIKKEVTVWLDHRLGKQHQNSGIHKSYHWALGDSVP